MIYTARIDDHGRSMMAYSIPLAVDPALRGEAIADISGIHLHSSSTPDVEGYRRSVDAATEEQVELARPQMYFVLTDLKERAFNSAMQAETVANGAKTPLELVTTILDGVSADAARIFADCDSRPKGKGGLQTLDSVSVYLAEIAVFARTVADRHDAAFAPIADMAERLWQGHAEKVDRFREETAARYPGVAETVRPSSEAHAAAVTRVAGADLRSPVLGNRRFDDVIGACGDWRTLSQVGQGGEKRRAFIEKGWHRPVTGEKARTLRADVCELLRDFDRTYNAEGFVAELRRVAVGFRHHGMNRIDWAKEHTEAQVKGMKKGLYDSDEKHRRRIEDALEKLPQDRLRTYRDATSLLARAHTVSSFLAAVDRSLHPERELQAFVSFTDRDGVLVGLTDVPSLDAMVVYDDLPLRAAGRHELAVYAVRMPVAALAGGVPTLGECREAGHPGTNFRSVEECLAELDGAGIERTFFFDGIEVVGHDGFVAVGARKAPPSDTYDEDDEEGYDGDDLDEGREIAF
jgi:hypothetical protein